MPSFTFNSKAALLASSALIMVASTPVQAQDDHKIESSIKSSYNFKTYLKDDTIKVDSSHGMVTLTGTVAQEWHRTLAQETASEMSGVKSVNNQLKLTNDQPSDHSDGWITMKVKSALIFHRNVNATATEVNTVGGVVTLTGSADSSAQKELTGEYAKDVDGVTEVRNDLVVAKPAKPVHDTIGVQIDDASITAQVKTTLLFHKSTRVLATKVVTKEGVVTLRGEAKNAAERDLVTKITDDVKGVKHVHNKMTVKS